MKGEVLFPELPHYETDGFQQKIARYMKKHERIEWPIYRTKKKKRVNRNHPGKDLALDLLEKYLNNCFCKYVPITKRNDV